MTNRVSLLNNRTSSYWFARVGFALLSSLLLTFAAASTAQAQDVDWLVNIDDIVDSVNYDPTPAGGTVRVAIAVTNNGFGTAPATTVSFTVPATVSLQAVTGTITGCLPALPAASGTVMTCNVPVLGDGDSAVVNVDFLTTTAQVLVVQAEVPTTGESPGASTLNNANSETITVTSGADIGVTITTPPTVASGSFFDYTVTAENFGPNTADSYRITVPVPAGVTNITPPAGCSLSAANYVCTINTALTTSATRTFTFNGQVSAGGGSDVTAQTNVDNVSPGDLIPANDQDTATFDVTAGTDAFVSKSRSPGGTLLVGDPITFTIAAGYTGDAPTGATISDLVPSGYTINSVTGTGGFICNAAPFVTQQVTCVSPGGGAAGANQSLGGATIVATANAAGTGILNTATLSTTGSPDSNLANNSDDDGGVTIAQPVVDFEAQKTGPVPRLAVVNDGGANTNTYNYNIRSRNIGNAAFFGTVVLTDAIPVGMRVEGLTLNGFTCTVGGAAPSFPITGPASLACERDYTSGAPLAAGASTPNVTLNVAITQPGTITNTMTVSTVNPNIADLNPANDVITYDVEAGTGPNSADISAVKRVAGVMVNPPNAVAGQPYTFDLEIVNAGPAVSTNVRVLDRITELQNGNNAFTVTYANTPSGSCSQTSPGTSSRTLDCTIASVPVCTSGSNCPVISVTVVPGRNLSPRTNTFSAISQNTPDGNLGNNSDGITYNLDPRADVTVNKTAPATIDAGRDLTYVVTAQNLNNGLSTAQNVTITDTLPADVTFISVNRTCSTVPAAGSVTTSTTNNQLVCNLGAINNGVQATAIVVVRPNNATNGSSITNNVVVATSTTETDLTNNAASVVTTVAQPDVDIIINKSDNVDPLGRSENVTYTLTVTNAGPSASENIVVTDNWLIDKISFQSVATSPNYTCSLVPAVNSFGGVLRCEIPYLVSGASVDILTVGRGDAKGAAINNVSVSSDEILAGYDRESLNNQTEENTTVRSRADVQVVSKIANPGTVNLNDNFEFVVTVRTNTGANLFEADEVAFTDTLPSNMRLVGAPTAAVINGSATSTSCTGAVGTQNVACNLGTMDAGTLVEITIPVEVTLVTVYPQTVTNTASVTTTSQEVTSSNNSNSGNVIVESSSIAGTVFRDFADDTDITAGDTRISGVTMTLTGESFDNPTPGTNNVTRTLTTDTNGNFMFDFLPAGVYTITRGGVSEPFLVDGTNTPGNNGGVSTGTVVPGNIIQGIMLPANTDNVENLFPVIPQARIGIAKEATLGSIAADGSFTATFNLVVENFSLEPLINVSVTDQLSGADPLFGTYVNLATPSTNSMSLGSYTILAAPSGTCGSPNVGFNGNGDLTVSSGGALAIGGTCTLSFSLRILPDAAQAVTGFENQAVVNGEGEISGQTSATNPQLTDLSDDGVQPDADNDNQGNEAGENDPTPVVPAGAAPSIALVKIADISAITLPVETGDTLSYNFQVRNTGDVTLTNVTITENLIGAIVTGTIASLAPGATDTTSITATYNVTLAQVDAGEVINSATVSGTDPFGTVVTDDSGTDFTDDTPTRTALVEEPMVAIVKTIASTTFQNPPQVGDVITYAFTIRNTGNVTLTNVNITDPLVGLNLSGTPIASMVPGEENTTAYTATYAITLDDIEAQEVRNRATVFGTAPDGTTIVEDESSPVAGTDEDTVQPVTRLGAIELNKIADTTGIDDGAVVGDVIPFSFEITNIGNVPLDNVTITDAHAGFVLTGAPFDDLQPGASNTIAWSGTYALTAADITAGEVVNTADVTGTYGPTDTEIATDQDVETAAVGKIEAIPEVFPPFTTDGGTTTTMLASDLLNNAPVTLDTVTIMVISADDGVTLDPATGLITLAPGYPAGEYEVTYKITSKTNPGLEDTTTETVVQGPLPAIETVKTQALADTNGDGRDSAGDLMTYKITVTNTGNVPLENVGLVDTLTDFNDAGLDLTTSPTFVSTDDGSTAGNLKIGETATYTATYVLELQAVNAGGIRNTVTASGLGVYGPGVPGTPSVVTDVSDDDDDTDGNTADDPTEFPIVRTDGGVSRGSLIAGLSMTKTTPSTVVRRSDVVPYTITITNVNPFAIGPTDIIDRLPEGLIYIPGSATINGAAADVVFIAGRVTWDDVTIAAGGDTVVALNARVLNGARSGNLVNVGTLLDGDGDNAIAPPASAVVQIIPEAVFDCTDVIGKVFNDINGNGYQDGPETVDRSAITDQTYDGGKGAALPPEPRDESGIPGVRLATVDGTVITTDENGLYNVPCAALAANSGSNFILKVDTRSLPTGYRMTTENPRVVRITPGMMTEMNFGATAAGQVVRVDLNANAFGADGALTPDLINGLRGVLQQIAGTPSNMVLAFHIPQKATSDDVRTARALLDRVEAQITADWRSIGRVRLRIEHSIVRAGQ